jgi:hypothetical protein
MLGNNRSCSSLDFPHARAPRAGLIAPERGAGADESRASVPTVPATVGAAGAVSARVTTPVRSRGLSARDDFAAVGSQAGPRASARFHATREAPGQARHFVATQLSAWGVSDRKCDDVVLAVSELVSDAARYPMAVGVELELARRGDRLHLEVRDACPSPPLCADDTAGGWLARVVLDRCSEHWDWATEPPVGRVVRASFSV